MRQAELVAKAIEEGTPLTAAVLVNGGPAGLLAAPVSYR